MGNVVKLALSGTIISLLNKHIINEYKEVLRRPKFHFTTEIIDSVVDEIISIID